MSKLTDSRCRNIKANGKIQKLTDGEGLYLHITPTGQKLWRMAYRFTGKQKTLAFGKYPTISLADARTKRDEAKKMLADNTDPSLIKKIEKNKLIAEHDNTFEKIAREWHAKQEKHITPKYWKEKIHRLSQDIFPQIGNMPIDKITSPMLLKVIHDIENRGANEMAKRALQVCSNIFDHGIATSRCKNNPANAIKKGLSPKKTKHYPCILIQEIPLFISDINNIVN